MQERAKFSIDYTAQEPKIGSSSLGLESTTVVDNRTVDIRPTAPNLRLVDEITHPTYVMLAPGSDPLKNANVTCSGPFKVVEYRPQERLVVERNDKYWGKAPSLSRITFRFIPDDTTRLLSLQSGEVDLITDVPRSLLATVKAQQGLSVQTAPTGQVTLMKVARRDAAGSDKILADPADRRAVAHAIDRKSYVEGILDGNGEVVNTVVPPSVLGEFASTVEGIPYDPKRAASLLDQAGWGSQPDGIRSKNGRRLELTMIFSPGGGGTGVGLTTVEFVQAELRKVGIAAKIEQLDVGAYSRARNAGNYDLDFTAPNQNDANPAGGMSRNYYSKSTSRAVTFNAPGPDSEFESLIDQTDLATDRKELQRLAARAMHQLVDVEVATIPLAGTFRIYGMKNTVKGLEPHPSSTNQRWNTVYITK